MIENFRPGRRVQKPLRRDSWGEALAVLFVVCAVVFMAASRFVRSRHVEDVQPVAQSSPSADEMPSAGEEVQPQLSSPSPVYRPQASGVAFDAAETERQRQQDQRTFQALHDNCQRAIDMNADGQYPAMQVSACGDYQRFASKLGQDVGPLPEVREAAPQRVAHAKSPDQAIAPGECMSLQAEKDSINARMRSAYTNPEGEWFRETLRKIDARMWDLNCRQH